MDFEFEEEPGGADMCKAMEKRYQEKEIMGSIMGMRIAGMTDDDILTKVMEAFHVTREYVLALIAPKQA